MIIRAARAEDVPFLIDCIKDEYADTYLKRDFYDPNYVAELIGGERYRFYVAEWDGEIAGMLALKGNLPRETSCELASGVVLKKYRRRGIMTALFNRLLEGMRRFKGISAAACVAVTYHDIVQRSMERLGFTPVGLILSTLLIGRITHSFRRDGNLKHPHALLIRAVEKKNVGRLFVPSAHRSIAKKIYSELGVRFEFGEEKNFLHADSKIMLYNDETQRNCTIEIDRAGSDLAARLEAIHDRFDAPLQTFNVFLNASDESSISAYEILRRAGYFFTGFKPLCSEREQMILHNPRGVSIDLHDVLLTEKFAALRDCIERSVDT